MIQLKVNGKSQSFQGDPEMPLLWYLRDVLGLPVTKLGCGAEITTIEGVGGGQVHPVQKAWVEANVPQCGYCQSGQIMQAISLLAKTPKPTDEEIDDGMQGNSCRCGTYQRIRAAIKAAAGVTA